MRRISNPDIRRLAHISSELRSEYQETSEIWMGSPFEWIRRLPPRQKGKIAEVFVSFWLKELGFSIETVSDSDADLMVNRKRIEIKFSTLWGSGVYKFQQLRDQNYHFVLCFGLSPFDAHCWLVPKRVVLYRWNLQDGIVPQHRGASGTDTAWLSFLPEDPPSWIVRFGGQLSQSQRTLKRMLSSGK